MLAELESHFQKYLYGCNVKTRGRQSSGMTPTSVHPADSPVAVVPVWLFDQGRGLAGKGGGRFFVTELKGSLPTEWDFSLALAMISG